MDPIKQTSRPERQPSAIRKEIPKQIPTEVGSLSAPVEQAPLPPIDPPEVRPETPTPEIQEGPGGIEETMTPDEGGFLEKNISLLRKKLKTAKKKGTGGIPIVRDDLTVQVERIMEEGLQDAYRELTVVQQQEFKIKGEETALKIRELLRSTKVKIKRVIRLLIEWLRLLPGVNRFFLEQEAKIKADRIVALKRLHDHHK